MATDEELLLIRIEASQTKLEKEMAKAINTLDRGGKRIAREQAAVTRRIEQAWGGLGRSLTPALAGVTAALSVREIALYADSWREAGNKVAASGTPLDQVQTRLEQISEVATRSRSSLESTASTYQRIRIATERLGVSEQDALKYTEILNKSFIAGGASATEAASAALQLAQALGSGTLQGDELRSLRENAPLLSQAIADAMHVSVGELKNLGAQGKITADIILKAMDQASAGIEDKFSKTQITLSQAFQNLETAFTRFVGEASGGAIDTLANSIDFLAQHVEDAAKSIGILAAAMAPAGLAAAAKKAGTAVGALWEIMARNPLGAALAVLSAAAAAVYLYRDKIDPLSVALKDNQKAQEDLNKVLKDARDHNNELAKSERDRAISTAKATIADLEAAKAAAQKNAVLIKQGADDARSRIAFGVATFANPFAFLTTGAEAARQSVSELGRAIEGLAPDNLIQGYKDQAAAADKAIAKAKENLSLLEKTKPGKDDQDNADGKGDNGVSDNGNPKADSGLIAPSKYAGPIQPGLKEGAQAITQGQERLAQMRDEIATLGQSTAAVQAYAFKMEALRQIQAAGGQVTEEQRKAIDDTAAAMEQAGTAIEAFHQQQSALAQAQQEAEYQSRAVARGLADVAVAGLHGFSSLKDAAASFLEQMAEMILRAKVLEPLLKGIGGGGGGGIFDAILSAIPGFATGTNYAPGGLAKVGEHGPELVNLPRGAQVIPHPQSMKMVAGSQVAVTVMHDGSTAIRYERVSDDHIRIIARQEADLLDHKNVPRLAAASIREPNSAMSKSLRDSLNTRRRRE